MDDTDQASLVSVENFNPQFSFPKVQVEESRCLEEGMFGVRRLFPQPAVRTQALFLRKEWHMTSMPCQRFLGCFGLEWLRA